MGLLRGYARPSTVGATVPLSDGPRTASGCRKYEEDREEHDCLLVEIGIILVFGAVAQAVLFSGSATSASLCPAPC